MTELNNINKNITTVIFDMDGVIVNSEPINLTIIDNIYKEIGINVPYEEQLSSLGVSSLEWWTHIVDKYNVTSHTPEDLYQKERDRIMDYFSSPDTDKGYFENMKETLEELKQKGYKTAIASSSHKKIIEKILDFGDLNDYFDIIVSGFDKEIEKSKPEPDIFLYTAKKLGSKNDESLVIEDSEAGLEAGKRANMTTAAFLSAPKPIKLDNADFSFNHYKDFFKNIPIIE